MSALPCRRPGGRLFRQYRGSPGEKVLFQALKRRKGRASFLVPFPGLPFQGHGRCRGLRSAFPAFPCSPGMPSREEAGQPPGKHPGHAAGKGCFPAKRQECRRDLPPCRLSPPRRHPCPRPRLSGRGPHTFPLGSVGGIGTFFRYPGFPSPEHGNGYRQIKSRLHTSRLLKPAGDVITAASY